MSTRTLSLAAALVIMAALALPAQACKSRPATVSLCTVAAQTADVRDAPNGRVTSGAAGIVRVSGQSEDGLWARVEAPCIGFMGWIAGKDLTCESMSANAQAPAKSP